MIVVSENTKEMMDNNIYSKLHDAFKKEIEAYWMYDKLAKESKDDKFIWALCEIMEDEYLHARYLRKHMIEQEMYDMDAPCEEKYREMIVDKMTKQYGWDD
jgi:rubrerythrin